MINPETGENNPTNWQIVNFEDALDTISVTGFSSPGEDDLLRGVALHFIEQNDEYIGAYREACRIFGVENVPAIVNLWNSDIAQTKRNPVSRRQHAEATLSLLETKSTIEDKDSELLINIRQYTRSVDSSGNKLQGVSTEEFNRLERAFVEGVYYYGKDNIPELLAAMFNDEE